MQPMGTAKDIVADAVSYTRFWEVLIPEFELLVCVISRDKSRGFGFLIETRSASGGCKLAEQLDVVQWEEAKIVKVNQKSTLKLYSSIQSILHVHWNKAPRLIRR